ncbi:MAG: hypothetical protein KDA69_14420 [Planctomycetaceae bacterium]|nr:hypothetical protein [Planctomycetaceae bacterium]MCB9950665.1 hypothetical protein [Planctomycetaceae bacterium]
MDPSTSVAAEGFPAFEALVVEPTNREPLEFRGRLLIESDGRMANEDDSASSPYHTLKVYVVEGGGFLVAIEFCNAECVLIDAEMVASLDELDDFFSIYAAGCFQEFYPAVTHPGIGEQETIRAFETQSASVLSQLQLLDINTIAPLIQLPYAIWSKSPEQNAPAT